jgi:PAS domain S-box-containing protein
VTNQPSTAGQPGGQRYRYLFENMRICIFVADLTVSPATILEVNRQTELVYGFTAAELVGDPAAQLVPEELRASVHNLLQHVEEGGQ